MKTSKAVQPAFDIASAIQRVRGMAVLPDMDLARIDGVPTKRLNEQVKRNLARFPDDFAFQLTAAKKAEVVANCDHLSRLKFSPVRPYAFTEQGAIMAANVLNSPQAVRNLPSEICNLKSREAWPARLDGHEAAIVDVLQRLMRLLDPPPAPEPPRRQIGFHVNPEGSTENRTSRRSRLKNNQR